MSAAEVPSEALLAAAVWLGGGVGGLQLPVSCQEAFVALFKLDGWTMDNVLDEDVLRRA